MINFLASQKIVGCMGLSLLGFLHPYSGATPVPDKSTEPALYEIYAEDDRLKEVSRETYAYEKGQALPLGGLYQQYEWVNRSYEEEERAETSHAYFDEQNRLLYALGYTANILSGSSSYCEENIYERDNEKHTCRYLYYKSNSMPWEDGYYIAFRYLFETSDFQFDEKGRLLRGLTYRRNVGSDPYGYSEELFFSRGYEADYDGDRLMAELQYIDYWGTNETGVWEYRIYEYNEQGDCIWIADVTEDEIKICCLEYDEERGQVQEYVYEVLEDWEFTADDGSTYYFRPQWKKPAVKKAAADGTVELELFYGKGMDLGQQHYLMPEDVEAVLNDHRYVVRPGDCLWNIARRYYGSGSRCDLIHHMNISVIGLEENKILPGMRLYLPEIGNAQDTKVSD